MTVKITRWSPDTCDCVIEYSWNDQLPAESREHVLSTYVKRCSDHALLRNDSERYNSVQDENVLKNTTLGRILENNTTPELYDETTSLDNDGNQIATRRLKDNVKYEWSWSGQAPGRVLNVSLRGAVLTTQKRDSIRNLVDTDRVILNG